LVIKNLGLDYIKYFEFSPMLLFNIIFFLPFLFT